MIAFILSTEAFSLEKSSVWVSQGRTFEMWVCPLVYALIGYCNEVIVFLLPIDILRVPKSSAV